MSWFKKILPKISSTGTKKGVPEGIWSKCDACDAVIYSVELERNLYVCSKCQNHMRMCGRKRLEYFLDENERFELASEVQANDRLKFKALKRYKDQIGAAQKKTGEKEALIVMKGKVHDVPLVAVSFDFNFIGNYDIAIRRQMHGTQIFITKEPMRLIDTSFLSIELSFLNFSTFNFDGNSKFKDG